MGKVSIDGIFFIVPKKNNEVLCAVDSVRSLPLFYFYDSDKILSSDDASQMVREFKLIGFDCNSIVAGNDTIIYGLMQLEVWQSYVLIRN